MGGDCITCRLASRRRGGVALVHDFQRFLDQFAHGFTGDPRLAGEDRIGHLLMFRDAGQPHALWHAALGAGLAELVGMTAGAWLSDEKARVRAGSVEAKLPKPRFAAFALSHRDEKVAKGEIRSAKGHCRLCQSVGGGQPSHGALTLMQFIKIDVNYKTLRMSVSNRFA